MARLISFCFYTRRHIDFTCATVVFQQGKCPLFQSGYLNVQVPDLLGILKQKVSRSVKEKSKHDLWRLSDLYFKRSSLTRDSCQYIHVHNMLVTFNKRRKDSFHCKFLCLTFLTVGVLHHNSFNLD